MNENLPGRVDNTTLPTYKPLLPLFDAVINSIHAIEDRRPLKAGAGSIAITVKRDQAQAQLPGTTPEIADEPVAGFEIGDDGIGFNEANRESFNTADSQYKKARGSKGIGRFLWLKAFKRIHISSAFRDGDSLKRRDFDFSLPDGITNERVETVEAAPDWKVTAMGTTLTLDDLQRPYKDTCPKGLEAIADRIIDHCLVFLVRPDAPRVLLRDQQHSVQINDRLRDHHAPVVVPPEAFKVKGHDLVVQHFHVKAKAAKPKVHYVANQREVVSEAPADPDLNQRLPEADGSSTFALVSYVSGQLLDQHLNQERTGFTLPSRNDAVLADDVTIEDLREATNAKILAHALPFVSPLQDLKMQQITDAIHTQFPQYRPLLARHRDEIKKIPPGLSPDKLEVELHKIRARLTVETKENVKTFLAVTDHKDYAARFEEVMTKLNDVGKAALIENVVHRKLVLEILSRHLQRRAAGEVGYYLEEDIHRVIFPMKKTSDEVPFEDQNLWVIDEKLSYHRYLASDKTLKELSHLNSDDEDRPDIVIWNTPFALTDDPGSSPYGSVVVVEFKRPQRASYPESEESPNDQVVRYVRKIQENKATDRTGRPIRVTDSTPFYAYILADLTPALSESLIDAGFIETPDRNGYYVYVPGRHTWIEVTSYDKLVNDAKKRNRNLFEALGLPTA